MYGILLTLNDIILLIIERMRMKRLTISIVKVEEKSIEIMPLITLLVINMILKTSIRETKINTQSRNPEKDTITPKRETLSMMPTENTTTDLTPLT